MAALLTNVDICNTTNNNNKQQHNKNITHSTVRSGADTDDGMVSCRRRPQEGQRTWRRLVTCLDTLSWSLSSSSSRMLLVVIFVVIAGISEVHSVTKTKVCISMKPISVSEARLSFI